MTGKTSFSMVSVVKFEQVNVSWEKANVNEVVLLSLVLILNILTHFFSVSIVEFEKVNVS